LALNESFLQELKYKIDIEDVISSYISLKKRGNTSVGLCPFHNEKTPSFTVYNDTQSFYCFGCGAGGDAVGFIRKIENLDYIDAVKLLAQRAGLQMPQDGFDDSLSKRRRRILEINRETAKFYYSYMISPHGKIGLDYFLNRGLTMNTIKRFGLGYAPNEWDLLLKHLKS
jgi:DNA primase